MGCTQTVDMPLQKTESKRSYSFSTINTILTEKTKELTEENFFPNKHPKIAVRTLLRYIKNIRFRALYCTFKFWKKSTRLEIKRKNFSIILISCFHYNMLVKPVVSIEVQENIINLDILIEPKHSFFVSTRSLPILLPRNYSPELKNESENLIKNWIMEKRQESPILDHVIQNLIISDPSLTPYPQNSTFKLFEELMDEKYELDRKELKEYKKIRSLLEFLIDHLNRRFGIQSVAQKILNRLFLTLDANKTHPYLFLFNKLLNKNDESHVSLNFLAFLCRARVDFNKLVENTLKKISKLKIKLPAEYEKKDVGGFVFLSDLLDYINKKFKLKQTKKLFFQKICPKTLSLQDYILFFSSYQLSKNGKNLSDSNLLKFEVSKIIKKFFGKILDSGQITSFENFLNQEDFKTVLTSSSIIKNGAKCMVSKSEFLYVLFEVYEELKQKYFLVLRNEFRKHEKMGKNSFLLAVTSLDQSFDNELVFKMFREGLASQENEEMKEEVIQETTFVEVLISYCSGLLKDFGNLYAEVPNFNKAYLDRRVNYADICLNSQDAIDLHSPLFKTKSMRFQQSSVFSN